MATILVIDEDGDVLEFVRSALAQAGHHAVAVSSVRIAEKLLATQVFEAVVLEVILQEKEGVETILQLKELWPHCPIVAISAGGPRLSAHHALTIAKAVGADETLPKPFSASELAGALEQAMARCGRAKKA